MKKLIALLLTFAMMAFGVTAFAEAPAAGQMVLSPDGILSIQMPSADGDAKTSEEGAGTIFLDV